MVNDLKVRRNQPQWALRHFVCKENRVEKRQEPLSLPLQMPVMLLNGELKAALLILSSRSRSHLGPPVTGGATRCAKWLASCVPAARKVTKSHWGQEEDRQWSGPGRDGWV